MNEYGSERLWIYESRIWTADKYGSVTKQTPPQRLFFFFKKLQNKDQAFKNERLLILKNCLHVFLIISVIFLKWKSVWFRMVPIHINKT